MWLELSLKCQHCLQPALPQMYHISKMKSIRPPNIQNAHILDCSFLTFWALDKTGLNTLTTSNCTARFPTTKAQQLQISLPEGCACMQHFSAHYTADLGRLHKPPPVKTPRMLSSQPSAAALLFSLSFSWPLTAASGFPVLHLPCSQTEPRHLPSAGLNSCLPAPPSPGMSQGEGH